MEIVVAGTGYVGLVTGVALASVGHKVTCLDIDENKLEMMRQCKSPIYENGLEELMMEYKNNLTYTSDYKIAYGNADAIFIGVGTPEKPDGSANLTYIYNVADQIAESITKNVVVIIKSTVPIGTNDEIEKYLRDKVNGKYEVDVVSNPEFLAQGTAVRDTLNASRIVVGTETDNAKNTMQKIYQPLIDKGIPFLSVRRRSAEMIKYASNVFLALKISYINEIANLCETLEADIDEVTKGMSFDKRIGDKFLNAGIGYGGSCFPKDTKALHFLSKEKGAELKTVKAGIEVNEKQKTIIYDKIKKQYGDKLPTMNIGILGLTFKPETDDLREAPSLYIVKELLADKCKVSVYDPIGMPNFKKKFNDDVTYCDSIEELLSGIELLLVLTEWEQFKEINISDFKKYMKETNIYDGRNIYNKELMLENKINYNCIGK